MKIEQGDWKRGNQAAPDKDGCSRDAWPVPTSLQHKDQGTSTSRASGMLPSSFLPDSSGRRCETCVSMFDGRKEIQRDSNSH